MKPKSKEEQNELGKGKQRKKMSVKSNSLENVDIFYRKGSHLQGVHELKQNYLIGSHQRVLGQGSFGKVFLSESIHNKNLRVAIKALDKEKLRKDVELIREEVAILNKLDHPNIVNYYETYNDYKYVYLVMEFINGKVLNKYFVDSKAHSEQ